MGLFGSAPERTSGAGAGGLPSGPFSSGRMTMAGFWRPSLGRCLCIASLAQLAPATDLLAQESNRPAVSGPALLAPNEGEPLEPITNVPPLMPLAPTAPEQPRDTPNVLRQPKWRNQ